MRPEEPILAHPPSMDSLLSSEAAAELLRLYGRNALKEELRRVRQTLAERN